MSEDERMTATEAREKRAIDAYRNEVRFRWIVDHVVHEVMEKHRIRDVMTYEPRDLHDLLTDVAAQVLKGVYEEDAELRNLTAERDAYKAKALEFVALVPPRPLTETPS